MECVTLESVNGVVSHTHGMQQIIMTSLHTTTYICIYNIIMYVYML